MTESTALAAEIRELAAERDAVILAHNYQRPEVQDVADFVGDSLGLSRQAASTDADDHRLRGRALHGREREDTEPEKTVLLPEFARAAPWPTWSLASSCARGSEQPGRRRSSPTSTPPRR